MDYGAVGERIREIAAELVVPRFQMLAEGDVSEKGPGDLVTVVDVEVERELTAYLRGLGSDALVVGEEAVAADPGVLEAGRRAERAWVIDPIDGTRNFVAGWSEFAVMVALIERGETVASWIHHPVADRLFSAVRGAGAEVDGEPLRRAPVDPDAEPEDVRVVLVDRLIPAEPKARVRERATGLALEPNRGAAGVNYPLVCTGELDVIVYWRTLVWDHAPGVLLLQESGGHVTPLDGGAYDPWAERQGLLVAADPATHERALARLAPDGAL